MRFREWAENKISVMQGGEISGTDGAQASLRAIALDGQGGHRTGRFGGPSSTFLDPGTWIRNLEFKGVDDNSNKIYRLEASFNQGKSWFPYEIFEKPILKDMIPETTHP